MATKTDVRRNIKVSLETYQELKRRGYMGETFDDVIKREFNISKEKKGKIPPSAYENKIG